MTVLPDVNTGVIHVSVREGRLTTDRVLLTLNIPEGYVPAMREAVLASQSLGLGGFAHLHDNGPSIAQPYLDAVTVRDQGEEEILVGGGGIHAWVLVPTVVDLVVERTRRVGSARMTLTDVRAPEELQVMSAMATRYGAVIDVEIDGATGEVHVKGRNAAQPRSLEDWDPLLFRAMRDRFAVQETMWRSLYSLSNKALAPDSVVSRRHAGPVILLDDGTIVGRQPADDDFDPKMLKSVDDKGEN